MVTAGSDDQDATDPDHRRHSSLRAATMLRRSGSMSFDMEIEEALGEAAGEMDLSRSEVIRHVLRQWVKRRSKNRDKE